MTKIPDLPPFEHEALRSLVRAYGAKGIAALAIAMEADQSDSSIVFNKAMLDATGQTGFPIGLDWAYEDDEGISYFANEHEACAMQRDRRRAKGFDEITGERN